jgi:hypothetical protein
MTSSEKFEYKVVDILESYIFHIKVTSIRVRIKKLQFFENELSPTFV